MTDKKLIITIETDRDSAGVGTRLIAAMTAMIDHIMDVDGNHDGPLETNDSDGYINNKLEINARRF